MSIAHQPVTWRQFERMEFEHPTELVRGEISEQEMPTSQHGSVCALVAAFLVFWARTGRQGAVFSNDSHVLTERDPDTVRGPDCAFIRRERLPEGKLPAGVLEIPVDLAVEVLSPTDRWTDVLDKVLEYLRSGVREVWVIDPQRRSVAVHQPDQSPMHFAESETLTRPELLPGFACPVAELFADL
jgi:Uma2 family endonuclease